MNYLEVNAENSNVSSKILVCDSGKKRKIKVLHIYKTYYPDTTGGIEMVLQQLMLGLQHMNVESRLLVLSSDAEPAVLLQPEGMIVRCRTTLEIASNPMSVKALKIFREQVAWADVLHYQFPWPFGDLLHIAGGRRKPAVVSYQSDIVRQKGLMRLYRPLMQYFLHNVDRVCASSPNYIKTSEVLSQLRTPVTAIPNGIDEEICPLASDACINGWREKVGEGFFLFVGVLRYYKGLHTLVEAAARTGLPVVIAGSGPENDSLRSQAQKARAAHVHFVGQVSNEDKSALLALCGFFVFPSHLRSEAFGMSLVEASIFGKPMISCEIGTGTTFVNIDGETGLTVPPEDTGALAAAMQRLYGDVALASRMGQAARLRYEQYFTGQAMARQYRQVYDTVASR